MTPRALARRSLAVALAAAGLSQAEERAHCLERRGGRLQLEQALYGSVNSLGLEHQLRLGWCAPLVPRPGPLFGRSNAQAGAMLFHSPTLALAGAFVRVTPVSPVTLRAELTGVAMWPIPLPGSGYLRFADPQSFTAASLEPADDPSGRSRAAVGWRVNLGVTLRARAPVSDRVALVAWADGYAERWAVGDGPYFYNPRADLVVRASGEWFVSTHALVGAEVRLGARYRVRAGAYDHVFHVPSSGFVGNQVGGFAYVGVDAPSARARVVELFVRAGVYTHHPFRQEAATLLGGVSVDWDLRADPRAD